jgi:hypothetical protein
VIDLKTLNLHNVVKGTVTDDETKFTIDFKDCLNRQLKRHEIKPTSKPSLITLEEA